MAISLAHSTFSKSSFLFHRSCVSFTKNGSCVRSYILMPLSSVSTSSSAHSANKPRHQKWRQPVASLVEIGGVKIVKEDVVRDDPTNNVPDTIFSKLGMQLHRRDQHPIGILKNAIYNYFDINYSGKFDKFDDLCPIVSIKQVLTSLRGLSMAISLAHSTFSKSSFLFHRSCVSFTKNGSCVRSYILMPLSSVSTSSSAHSANKPRHQKWRQPVASLVEIGGVKIVKEDVVRDDPTNNVPDTIFSKLGMQLHRRDQHPIGILKNAIYNYFDINYSGKFDKFDDLCPIVSIKQNFDDVLVPIDHVSGSYNDTYYIDPQTVLRCHTSAHQAEILSEGHTHFLVIGDVYRRDSIDSTHYPVFHQMEGVRVFSPDECEVSAWMPLLIAADLKKCLEGLARHLFGELAGGSGCGVMEQEILKRSGKINNVAWAFGLGLERLAMVLFDIPDIRLFWSADERFTSQFSEGQLGVKFKPFSKFPPCYKDMSFWINDSFTENNLCEVVRGVAGDLVEEDSISVNGTFATDEEINQLQWNVREAAQCKLNVVLR